MRDINTGELIGLAPNYDNNMALISRGYPSKTSNKDLLIELFNELLENCPRYRSMIPVVTEEILDKSISKLNMKVKTRFIVNWIIARYKQITV